VAGPDDLHRHFVRVAQQHALGHHLGLVVFGDGLEFQVFGHLWFVLDAIDAARGGVHDLLHAGSHRLVRKLHGREATDLPGQLGIEVTARIVGDRGEMHDGIHAIEVD